MLIDSGADVNAQNSEGRTPLMTAIGDDATLALIQEGADLGARDKRGKTALDLAWTPSKKAILERSLTH